MPKPEASSEQTQESVDAKKENTIGKEHERKRF